MKNRKIILITVLFACIGGLLGFARFDDDVIKKVATQLTKWTSTYPQEKVYLHMDKPYYAVGDNIWFKAYITSGSNHQLSNISGILNVELINDQDSITKAIKLPVSAGMAWGDFKLTDSLSDGNYRIRAYTNYMRNYSDDFFFDKTIQVGNSISNTVYAKANYTYTAVNTQQKVTAAVVYTDVDGKPYATKEVKYEVQLDNKSIARGKGITDAAGNFSFSFTNNSPALLKSGNIVTHIQLDPKQTVTRKLPIKAASNKVDVQFFPESGYMVGGIRSKVAFKAVGADGLGIDVKGTVVDEQNNEIAAIATQHLGMGYFAFTPEAGKTYSAKMTYPDGSESKLPLPAVSDKGYVLNVYNNPTDENVIVRISVSAKTLQENPNADINLVAQSGGTIVYAAKTKLESAAFSTKILKSRFPSGITQFTLFSGTGEPLNERIIFIQNPDVLNLALTSAKASYAPREKVKLNIAAKDKDGKAMVGGFSIAVTDETKVPVDEADESTILSNILLSSDIKGYIEKPNYYFSNTSDKTKADLDILMLTQGYRRFEWKQIMADNFPPLAFNPEKTLSISGFIKTNGGKAILKGKVTLISNSGGIFILDTLTDDKGHFAFKNLVFADSIKFVIQARNEKGGKNVSIELENVARQAISKNKNSGDITVNIDNTMATYLQNSKQQYNDLLKYGMISKVHILKEVSISDKKEPLKHSDNLNGAGNADQVIKGDQMQNCATLTNCLIMQAHFVNFRNGQAYSSRSPNAAMLVILDGVRMATDFNLDDLPSSDVESVEVLRTGAYLTIYGSSAGNGVLIVTTKRGGDDVSTYKSYAPGIMTYAPLGYYRTRKFYAPQYDNPKTNTLVPDLRSTIYWKPDVITNKEGTASVEFFNADTKGIYKAVIEGIDVDGNIARQVLRYKVE